MAVEKKKFVDIVARININELITETFGEVAPRLRESSLEKLLKLTPGQAAVLAKKLSANLARGIQKEMEAAFIDNESVEFPHMAVIAPKAYKAKINPSFEKNARVEPAEMITRRKLIVNTRDGFKARL